MKNYGSIPLGKAGITLVMSLALGLLFNCFFFGTLTGLNVPAYALLVVVSLFALAALFKQKISRQTVYLLLPLAFFSLMVFVRSSVFLTFLNIVGSVLLLLLIAKVSLRGVLKDFLMIDYVKIFFLPFLFLPPVFQTLSDIVRLRGIQKDKKIIGQIVSGIAMALPVLLIFVILFSSADLVFRQYISGIFDLNIEEETAARIFLVTVATIAFIGAYTYIFQQQKAKAIASNTAVPYALGHIEGSIFLGSINVLFFIFLLVQLTYLFGGQDNIAVQGFTYAEYARHGFFELIAVALISLSLLLSTEKYSAKNGADHTLSFKIVSSVLVVQVIVIMVSAFTRLSLYEAAYGFTTLRLYSHAFILFLGVIFVLLFLKIHKNEAENTFAFRSFISIMLFLAAMNILNPDAFIARKNIETFTTSEKLDASYLGRLSDDAVPILSQALKGSYDEEVKSEVRTALNLHLVDREASGSKIKLRWGSWNLSRMRATKMLPGITGEGQYR